MIKRLKNSIFIRFLVSKDGFSFPFTFQNCFLASCASIKETGSCMNSHFSEKNCDFFHSTLFKFHKASESLLVES